MYEDSWYSFVPEAHGKQDDGHTQKSHYRRRESLLKQPNDTDTSLRGPSDTLIGFLEGPSSPKSPPLATVARRAKSYSDFYQVARAQLTKDSRKIKIKEREPSTLIEVAKSGTTFEIMYESYEDELLIASQEEFEIYRDQLALSVRHLDGLLHDTTSALDLLASLSDSFKSVEAQTTAFQEQCEDLLAEQKHIKTLFTEVGDGLQYYAYLEPITRRLNAPGVSSVIGDEGYVDIMTNLDACIEFMINHPEHRESDIYLTRYKSLLARILTLIGNMFTKSIESSAIVAKRAEAQRRQAANNRVTMTSLFVFQSPASIAGIEQWRESMKHIVEQAHNAVSEITAQSLRQYMTSYRNYLAIYEDQLKSMMQSYIKTRSSTLPDYVELLLSKTIAVDIDPHANPVRYTRECVNSALEICGTETVNLLRIFSENFDLLRNRDQASPVLRDVEKGMFRDFLTEIATLVYKVLLPHLQHAEMSAIVDLAMWLNGQAYYRSILGETVSSHSDDEGEEISHDIPTKVKAQVAGQINNLIVQSTFGHIRDILLRDVERYAAKPGDLIFSPVSPAASSDKPKDWSEKILEDGVGARLEKALGPGFLEAYIPVGIASRLLLHVHDLTFEYGGENGSTDIAYEIIHQTCRATIRAADQVAVKLARIDGRIFAIKNLVLLKNLVLAYEIAGSRRASVLDFTDIWATFAELRSRGGLFDISSYYSLLTSGNLLPKVVENVQDARVELDGLLRENITTFREDCAIMMVRDVSSGKRGVRTAEDQIRKKLAIAFPQEEKLRETLWEAVQALADEKKGKK